MITGIEVGQTWAVISDIHGNALAFEAAMPALLRADRVVILGDLLTYGTEPERCMALLAELMAARPVDLVFGNHDQLYLDLLHGRTAYYDALPDWLREVVDWTARRVEPAWYSQFPWKTELRRGDVLAAHANPWPYPDWRYLSRPEDCRAALDTLAARGVRLGLFGHTHRPMLASFQGIGAADQDIPPPAQAQPWLLNPGSLGQGRTADNGSWFATLRQTPKALQVRFHRQPFDVAAHRAAILRAGLSEPATTRLLRYLPR